MENKFLFLSDNDVRSIIGDNLEFCISTIEKSFMVMTYGKTLQPDKVSQIIDEKSQNRINCLPSTIYDIETSGTKRVSVFPTNKAIGLRNVEGFTILSDTTNGKLKCLMNSTLATSIRTASVGAIAAKYLAKKDSTTIGFIGAGEEAKEHFKLVKAVRPSINKCLFSSRTEKRIQNLIDELAVEYRDVKFINCANDYEIAMVNSDIIVTAISSQQKVLKGEWIRDGMLYIHVAGLEDEFSVAEKADKIVCDQWESVKHRTQTISQMYNKGIIKDEDIYADLGEIISGEKKAREDDREFIYFNSVGLSVEDVYLANEIYNIAVSNNIGTWINK
ncbi:MAG: ornithine cyclodeaminase family protein [Peptoniphilaceae bacterium]|nr:ornithine cyclodeaminase family protein [Peptoniphilaceae bacterium]MDY6018300.1 ornithine cyclodeaminase family protein [Anaerococcus sp.]